MRTVWQDIGWKEPEMIEQINPERTIWNIPIEMDKDGGINPESGGINAESGGINPEDGGINSEDGGINSLLISIGQYPGSSALFFEDKLNKPKRTIERWLKKLRDEGKIEFRGSKKYGGYWLI